MSAAKRHATAARSHAVIAGLAQFWPRCFAVLQTKRKLLKIGIHKDDLQLRPLKSDAPLNQTIEEHA